MNILILALTSYGALIGVFMVVLFTIVIFDKVGRRAERRRLHVEVGRYLASK